MFNLPDYQRRQVGRTALSDKLAAAVAEEVSPQLDDGASLQDVNDYYNRKIEHKSEGLGRDRWQSHTETMTLETGDCEDDCIAKARELIEQGLADWSSMAVFRGVFRHPSTSDRKAEEHAMLVVRRDGELWGLDNQFVIVRPFSWWLTLTGNEPQVFDPHDAVTPESTWFYAKEQTTGEQAERHIQTDE